MMNSSNKAKKNSSSSGMGPPSGGLNTKPQSKEHSSVDLYVIEIKIGLHKKAISLVAAGGLYQM